MRYKRQTSHAEEENVFWVTMSDLLLGLLITFIVLFVFAITGFTQNKINQQEKQVKINEKLAAELKKNNIDVEIDKISGKIKISDLELFEVNKSELSPRGRQFLNKLVPIYLNSLLGNPEVRKYISQIIIEGHTDSQGYSASKNRTDNYIKNMDLSLRRAYSVANFIVYVKTPQMKKYQNDLIKFMSVNGKSFTEPIIVNGKEDLKKSRRVELKVQFKDFKPQDFLNQKFN